MIKTVIITNYLGESVTITLSEGDPEHGFLIEAIDGLGPAKADVHTTDLATNDGSLYNSARLNERNIIMKLIFGWAENADTGMLESIETVRQRTYKYWPIKKPVEILIEADNRIVKTTGYVESNEPDIFSRQEGNSISIICPDPYFYSAGEDGVNTTVFYGVQPLFEFIFSNESLTEPLIEFGSIENETEKTIYYEGDAEIGIVITIHAIGEADMITIYNTGTREVMRIDTDKLEALTGSGIKAGDDIIISTVRGAKYIQLLRTGFYTNILNCLDKDSDWFQLARGDNVFAYTAEYGSENLQFKIENRVIYEGV